MTTETGLTALMESPLSSCSCEISQDTGYHGIIMCLPWVIKTGPDYWKCYASLEFSSSQIGWASNYPSMSADSYDLMTPAVELDSPDSYLTCIH